MRHAAQEAGLELTVDSAGTGSWHIGKGPDPRSCDEASRHGIDITHYRARQVTVRDFDRFDQIVALDASNLANLERIAPASPTPGFRCCWTMCRAWRGRMSTIPTSVAQKVS